MQDFFDVGRPPPRWLDLGGFFNRAWLILPELRTVMRGEVESTLDSAAIYEKELAPMASAIGLAILVHDFWQLPFGGDPISDHLIDRIRPYLRMVYDALRDDPTVTSAMIPGIQFAILDPLTAADLDLPVVQLGLPRLVFELERCDRQGADWEWQRKWRAPGVVRPRTGSRRDVPAVPELVDWLDVDRETPEWLDLGAFANRVWSSVPESCDPLTAAIMSSIDSAIDDPALPPRLPDPAVYAQVFADNLLIPAMEALPASADDARRYLQPVLDTLRDDPAGTSPTCRSMHLAVLEPLSSRYLAAVRQLMPELSEELARYQSVIRRDS